MQPTNTSATEPKVIETPILKATATLRPFANARLRKEARNVFLDHATLSQGALEGKTKEQLEKMSAGEIMKFQDIPASVLLEIKEITAKHMITKLSIPGVGEYTTPDEILTAALDNLPDEDFDFIIKACDDIASSTQLTAEKKTT